MLDDASLHSDLSECNQMMGDVTTRKIVSCTVSAFYEDFLQRMGKMKDDINTDLAMFLYYNLDPKVRAAMEDQPNFSIPSWTRQESVREQYARVEVVRRAALRAEKSMRYSVQVVAKATGPRRGNFAASAITAFAGATSFHDAEAESQQWGFNTGADEEDKVAQERWTDGINNVICMMSAAETALTRDVGESHGYATRST